MADELDIEARRLGRDRALRVLRFGLVLVPGGYLATHVDLTASVRRIVAIGLVPYGTAFVTQIVSIALATERWRTLLRAYGAADERLPSFRALFQSTVIGLYYGLLPSGLVGDVVRAERSRGALPERLDGYVVLVMDRLAGLAGIAVLMAATIGRPEVRMLGASLRAGLLLASVGGAASVAILLAIPVLLARVERLRASAAKWPLVGKWLTSLTPIRDMRLAIVAIGLSALMQGACLLTVVALVAPIAKDVSLVAIAAVAPAILFATFVPVTPGAFGQREVAFVAFLASIGIDAESATAASVATTSLSFALGAIGGALVLAESLGRRRQ